MAEEKALVLIKRMQEDNYQPQDGDLKELLSGIQRSQGQLIEMLLMKKSERISQLITSRLVDCDKQFYSVLFTIVKSSQKWKQYKADILVISLIPTLLSLDILHEEELVSVLLLAIYTEYSDFINNFNETHVSLNNLPIMKEKYEKSFKIQQTKKEYPVLKEINQANLLEIHQMLLELLSKYLCKLDSYILNQIIRLGYIYCGVQFIQQDLKISEYAGLQDQIYKIQMSDKSMELLLIILAQIQLSNNSQHNISYLIQLLRKKAANESRFGVAGLAQSIKTVTDDIFEGVF